MLVSTTRPNRLHHRPGFTRGRRGAAQSLQRPFVRQMRAEVSDSWPQEAVTKGVNGAFGTNANAKRGKWGIVVVSMNWAISFWLTSAVE